MLKHRCPWCGEQIPVKFFRPSDPISVVADEGQIDTCPSCKKRHKSSLNRMLITFLAMTYVGIKFYNTTGISIIDKILFVIGLLCTVGILIGYYKLPYVRDYRTERSKRSGLYISALTIIVVNFITIVGIDFESNPTKYWLLFIICLFIILSFSYCIYCFAYSNRKLKEKTEQKPIVKTTIVWKKHKKQGLLWPRFQIMRGEIFPAYFLDTEEKLISSGLCVTLERIKWTGKRKCTCEISLVLDGISSEEYLQKGNHFYLYYYYRKIAEGIVQ